MATATPQQDPKLQFELTVMRIRERLMGYFKDHCVENFVVNPYIRWETIVGNRQYQYRREEADMQRKRVLYIGDIPLLEVQKQPNIVRLYSKTLTTSDILKQINGEINKVFHDYLPGVKVESVAKGTEDVSKIKDWMLYSKLHDEQPVDPFYVMPTAYNRTLYSYAEGYHYVTEEPDGNE
jgi:hypothetical protein